VSRRRAHYDDDQPGTLAAYLRDIAKLPRLTPDEECDLGRRIQQHRDGAAFERLVEGNLRFVVSCAKRYRGHGVAFIDLIHEGNLGLMEAAQRFDPGRKVRFISYAVWWIREAMMHVLADQTRAFSFPPKLFARLGGRGDDLSLSAPTRADAPGVLGDAMADERLTPVEDALIRRAELERLAAALGDLDRRERQVVRLRFGLGDDEPRTLQEIGDRLRLSRERVRQIEARATEKLRRSARLRSRLN
jgi:RNA polymerase primary sigma factor